jgi:pilus assembly protein CpaB
VARRVMAIIIALIVALLGAIGVVVYAQAADTRALAGQQAVSVYIATAEVPVGTTVADAVSNKLITSQQVVAKGVPAGALVKVDSTNQKLVATSAIRPGEVVLATRFGTLTEVTQTGGVPDGKVAITVTLTDPQRVAPLLEPGSHIVIYDSFNPRDAKSALPIPDGAKLSESPAVSRVTRVLLEDVQVIGVGSAQLQPSGSQTASPDGQKADQGNGALVTVAVSPAQAITLVHAIQTGTLYAGLRGKSVVLDRKAVVNDTTVLGN